MAAIPYEVMRRALRTQGEGWRKLLSLPCLEPHRYLDAWVLHSKRSGARKTRRLLRRWWARHRAWRAAGCPNLGDPENW